MFPWFFHGDYLENKTRKRIHFSRLLVLQVHDAIVIFKNFFTLLSLNDTVTDVTSSTTTYITNGTDISITYSTLCDIAYDAAIYVSYSKL